MNVCLLDVLARTPDFESVASTLELRSWEWDFLHVVDGEATLADVVRHLGLDLDTALGFVHEATHRGLLVVTTLSLQAYRLRGPSQTAIASSPRLYLGAPQGYAPAATPEVPSQAAPTAEIAPPTPEVAPIAVAAAAAAPVFVAEAAAAAEPAHAEPVHAEPARVDATHVDATHVEPAAFGASTISFSSDAFDWNETVEEADDHPGAQATDSVAAPHWDDRFGVEHPDGPFAAPAAPESPAPTFAQVIAPAEETPIEAAHDAAHVADPFAAPDPFSRAFAVDDPFATAPAHHDAASDHAPDTTVAPGTASPFADLLHDDAHDHDDDAVTPFAPLTDHASAGFDPFAAHTVADPFAGAHPVDDPFASPHPVADPIASAIDDPFAPHVAAEPAVLAEHVAPTPVVVAEASPASLAAPEPSNGKSHHPEPLAEPQRETTPGSISFSFSSDDPLEIDETPEPPRASQRIPEPVYVPSDVVYHDERPAAAAPAPAASTAMPAAKPADPVSTTQSTYYEREAIDGDAARDLDEKTKNWKESLSWREQQQLNEAAEFGKPKAGVIGSLLRALGVR